ncbi:MAG: hypothetical protein ACJ76Z_14115 [Thermoleophilaceae bacterium]
MKRITLTIVAILLAAPTVALAKSGIEFSPPAEATETGHTTHFNIILLREPPNGGGRATPMGHGKRPLVTFVSKSGRVVRVRGTRVTSEGLATGTAIFPDKGPWRSSITIGGKRVATGEEQPGFEVGTGIVNLDNFPPDPAPSQSPAPAHDAGGGFPWAWVLSIAAIAAALLVLAVRTGRMPARLRTLFGGGA